MDKYFKDFYGATALINVRSDNTARLIAYDGSGYMILDRVYNTYRGARNALGRLSDSWHERSM